MGASSAGSYEVTPPGRSRASDAAHRADRSTQRQQPTRQAYGESDPTGDATPILTGLRPSVPLFSSPRWRHSGSLWRRHGRPGPEYRSPHPGTWQDAVTSGVASVSCGHSLSRPLSPPATTLEPRAAIRLMSTRLPALLISCLCGHMGIRAIRPAVPQFIACVLTRNTEGVTPDICSAVHRRRPRSKSTQAQSRSSTARRSIQVSCPLGRPRTGTNACRRAPRRISGCAAYVLTIADRFAAIER